MNCRAVRIRLLTWRSCAWVRRLSFKSRHFAVIGVDEDRRRRVRGKLAALFDPDRGKIFREQLADFPMAAGPPMRISLPKIRRFDDRPCVNGRYSQTRQARQDAVGHYIGIGVGALMAGYPIFVLGWRQQHGEAARSNSSFDAIANGLEEQLVYFIQVRD